MIIDSLQAKTLAPQKSNQFKDEKNKSELKLINKKEITTINEDYSFKSLVHIINQEQQLTDKQLLEMEYGKKHYSCLIL